MKKIFFITFIFALLSNLSKSINVLNETNPYSKLIGKVRKELIDKSLLYLPKRNHANILEMSLQMKIAKDDFSLNNAESAYLVYIWICQNIEINLVQGKEDPAQVYELGNGNATGIASLFNRMSSFLDIKTGSISGIFKVLNFSE